MIRENISLINLIDNWDIFFNLRLLSRNKSISDYRTIEVYSQSQKTLSFASNPSLSASFSFSSSSSFLQSSPPLSAKNRILFYDFYLLYKCIHLYRCSCSGNHIKKLSASLAEALIQVVELIKSVNYRVKHN